jgi:hypothetical protein
MLAEMPEEATPICLGEQYAGASCAGSIEYDVAKLYALAGDWTNARREIESSVSRCDHASWSLRLPRAFEFLGEAREHAGDVEGARSAYQTVIARWGNLKPAATDADNARARLAALARK